MTYRVFPAGVVANSQPVLSQPIGYHHSWIVQLLPYIEQRNAFRLIDFKVGVYNPKNAAVRAHNIRILKCPSAWNTQPPGMAHTNYAATYSDVERPVDTKNNGTFFMNSFLSADGITDGPSSTLFLGEKPIDGMDLGWMSGTRATLRNTGTPLNTTGFAANGRVLTKQDVMGPSPEAAKLMNPKFVGGFGSVHPGGANFAFGDGSVRFLCETIAPPVFKLLGNRADGQMIDEDAF